MLIRSLFWMIVFLATGNYDIPRHSAASDYDIPRSSANEGTYDVPRSYEDLTADNNFEKDEQIPGDVPV